MTDPTPPTDKQIADAQATLARLAATSDPKKVMTDLMAMPEMAKVREAMLRAQIVMPAQQELSYAISMLARLADRYPPAPEAE